MHAFEDFVGEVAGQIVTRGEALRGSLPQLIRQRYTLYALLVGNRPYLGMYLKDKDSFTPAGFVKHLRLISSTLAAYDGYCIIAEGLPGYVRRRLVEQRIPFVDIGRQLFWPELGAAYRKKQAKGPLPKVENISPVTQVVLIYALNGGVRQPVTPGELSRRLGYTAMSMTRAYDEIEAAKLGSITRDGNERLLRPESTAVLWKRALPFLKDPVRSITRIMLRDLPQERPLLAGETALAHVSMLSPPGEAVYALWSRQWNALSATAKTIPIEDEGTCQLQLWRYDPALFADGERVDPFSLYLSLRNNTDERIESALDEMMEKLAWW